MSMKAIALTLGEPAGIGPDCVLRAWLQDPSLLDHICVIAPLYWLKDRATLLGIHASIEHLDHFGIGSKGVISCWNPSPDCTAPIQVGEPRSATAQAVVQCIESAAKQCLAQQATAMVTAPIEKAILKDNNFDFPGHTEFLAHLCEQEKVVMMLECDGLRIALLTIHIALSDVPAKLNTPDTLETIVIVEKTLREQLGIETPRIAMCGLNPHAGEQGYFGDEEGRILIPACQQARDLGIQITNPESADTLFCASKRQSYDLVICCYHDQGLIPIKILGFGDAVNVSMGLPIIRTSVDHGVALDIAGTSAVSCSSLIRAIYLASLMSGASA
ncbi:MAG: 4-hydroxythreonine-4-phosphate dehydrogenase PdxA [Mariprofundaceae bacterium]|nr:4-hydroxythreonine-4-phosphate dehydrogenase PdxA [Mariprofundaceae bacterium]